MKRLFLMFLAALTLVACDKGGNDTPTPPSPDTDQTVYADEIEKKDAVSFNAPQAWRATVSDGTTRATNSNVEWLQLSAYSGAAGAQSLSLSLMPNFTGESRKAEIKITSGETIITIIVEQKSTTEDNKAPQYKTVKRMNSTHNGKASGYIEFTYDNQQRVISCNVSKDNGDGGHEESYNITYSESQINFIVKETDEETRNYTYGLDKNGRVTYLEQLLGEKPERGNYTYNAQGYLTTYPQGVESSSSTTGGEGATSNPPTITHRYVYAENTWNGSNIIKTIIDEGHQYSREANYQYTDKLNNGLASIDITGGYKGQDFILFKEGSFGPKNKNLIKRETGTYTRDWSYEFDKDGNMTKFSIACSADGDQWTESHEIIYN